MITARWRVWSSSVRSLNFNSAGGASWYFVLKKLTGASNPGLLPDLTPTRCGRMATRSVLHFSLPEPPRTAAPLALNARFITLTSPCILTPSRAAGASEGIYGCQGAEVAAHFDPLSDSEDFDPVPAGFLPPVRAPKRPNDLASAWRQARRLAPATRCWRRYCRGSAGWRRCCATDAVLNLRTERAMQNLVSRCGGVGRRGERC